MRSDPNGHCHAEGTQQLRGGTVLPGCVLSPQCVYLLRHGCRLAAPAFMHVLSLADLARAHAAPAVNGEDADADTFLRRNKPLAYVLPL